MGCWGDSIRVPGGASGKEPTCQHTRCNRCEFDPWVGKIPWRRKWQPTPVLLPGESHGQRSLVGYSSWGCKESAVTEATSHTHTPWATHTHTHTPTPWATVHGVAKSQLWPKQLHTHTHTHQGKYIANSKCVILDFIYNIQTLLLAWSSPFCLCVLLLPCLPNFQGWIFKLILKNSRRLSM